MNKFIKFISAALAVSLCMPITAMAADDEEGMRGVWVSSVYNLDYPANSNLSVDELKDSADEILENIADMGLNTVFLQVRPNADALYDSDIFPWSHWLTGEQGKAPKDGFDPLEYWVDKAHELDLELHAWINPYRVTKGNTYETLAEDHPAKENPDWAVKYTDGNYYFDPGLPEVRQLVVDGAVEIVQNYDVDGIHMDDYFYPGQDFDDAKTFEKYADEDENLADWRRENVNELVRMLDESLHEENPDIDFGISPVGIWANKSTDPRGSDTKGYEGYTNCYSDSLAWIEEGTVDYIIPQIYWEIGNSSADFATLVDWWSENTKDSDVELYIGLAAYKCHDNTPPTWETTEPILQSLQYMSQNDVVAGEVYFRYQSLVTVDKLSEQITGWYDGTLELAPENAFPIKQGVAGFTGIFSMLIASLLR